MDRKLFVVCLLLVMGTAGWGQSSGADAWSKYSNAAGRFSVLLPGIPDEVTKPGPVYSFRLRQPTRLFLVMYSDFTESELKQTPSVSLAGLKESFLRTFDCKLISEREFKFRHTGMDLPALDFNCKSGSATFTVRIILNGRRFYGLVAGIKSSASSDDVRRFLSSFSMN